MSKKKMLILGFGKTISGVILLSLLLFWPAGTIHYPGAWRLLLIMFAPMLVLGAFLYYKAPQLLEKRLSTNESEKEQKVVILLSCIVFILSFLLCGLDYRYGWSHVPDWIVIFSCILFLITYALFAELLRENEFLSRTVEVQENQTVVSTGLYGIVRHPMYFIITFMFFSLPLILGSFVGLIPLLGVPLILVKRIKNEEQVLEKGLKGYKEYKKKVKYRLIPFVW
ncbi:MAG: isoprenylcysteine carboxylmethyltransferase family protein [Bacillota bacterium]|nr:isoprenylcysteine carboxylmethyltransferase family protein [Bacillota bacterium]